MGKDKILYTESSMTNLLSFGFLKEFESPFDPLLTRFDPEFIAA